MNKIMEKTERGMRWSIISEVIAKLTIPITNMILARLLTPEAFGVIATVTMIVSFADMFTDAGFQKYIVQHDFEDENSLNQSTDVAFWTNLFISVVFWVIIALQRETIAELVGNRGLGIEVLVASLSLPLTSFSSIQMARFKREFDFRTLFFVRVISTLIPFIVTIPLAFLTKSYWSMIIGTLTTNLFNAITLTSRSQWKPTFYYNVRRLKDMFSYSWWILLESISIWLTSYIGTFIVGRYLTLYYLGMYKTSMTTVNQITSLITASTSGPIFSALSRLKDNWKQLIDVYMDFIRNISVFLIPLGAGIFLYRDLVTEILLGAQWKEASEFVGLWGLTSTICIVLGTYCNGLYNAIGKTHLSFEVQISQLILLVPTIIVSAQVSYECLYISRSIVRLSLIFIQLIVMWRIFNISPLKFLSVVVPSVLCTFVMTMCSFILSLVSNSFVWQILSVCICILIYFVVLYKFFEKLFFDSFKNLGFDIKNNSIYRKYIQNNKK